MKKFLAVLLALAMLLSLAACGKKADKEDKKEQGKEEEQEQVETVQWGEFKCAATQETELLTNTGSTITIAPLDYENEYAAIHTTFLNNTESTKYLSVVAFAVNGMMFNVDLYFSADSGQEAFDMFGVSQNELRAKGIFEIGIVDLMFSVCDEDGNVEETLSCRIESDAAENYVADPQAYFTFINNQEAQSEGGYNVAASVDERLSLGGEIYLESKVYVENAGNEYLLLEVVNETSEMCYMNVSANMVNSMVAEGAGESITVFPGAKAILSVDMEWALPEAKRRAFGVEQISDISLYFESYNCLEDGSIDWEAESQFYNIRYTLPETSATPDMSGTVLYEGERLRVTAKAPVDVVVDGMGESTYVYLIFENVGQTDLSIQENGAKDIVVNGDEGKEIYFSNPYYLYTGDYTICHVNVDNMEGESVFLPLLINDYEDSSIRWEVDLTIPF